MIQQFKLIEKVNLTHNVYELVFEAENTFEIKAWQFITFLLEGLWGRAYSILELDWNRVKLIIKKRELEEGWRWGSKMICETKIWENLKWVWPAGHFLLQENNKNKLFIWTGTWIVPLYNMIIDQLKKDSKTKVELTFWVREKEDVFYLEKLEYLKEKYLNFDFAIYISRVKDIHEFKNECKNKKVHSWYTTNFLTKENMKNFWEIYICGMPKMIESTVEKLEKLWFKDWKDIFFEKY